MRTCGVVLLLVLRLLAAASHAAGVPAAAPSAAKPDEKASAKPSDGGESAAKKPGIKPPPPKGSQVRKNDNNCLLCHGESDLWDEKDKKMRARFIPPKESAEDIHFQKGVNCHDCHGGNYKTQEVNEAHATEDGFRALKPDPTRPPAETQAAVHWVCSQCHGDQALELVKGRHVKAGPKNDRGEGTLMACEKCHGKVSHHLLAAHDPRSPVFLDNQVETCGGCHQKDLATYKENVHGHGLYKSGLLVTASCASCHGAHGVYNAADTRSTLHPANVAKTCGRCHRFIAETLQKSVHGRGKGPGEMAERFAPGGKMQQHPSCTDCHRRHDIAFPESAKFRLQLPNLCGNCHGNLTSRYAMSIHGELTELGYGPGAKCSDCHGAHDILPVDDPESRLAPGNRLKTCQACHPYAVAGFTTFDPHADHHDAALYPMLHGVYRGMEVLLYSVFGFFGIHAVLWGVRSLVHTLKHGRPRRLRPGQPAFVRFEPVHRALHVVVIVSFLGLAFTGLPLKYNDQEWSKALARLLGGFDSTSVLHRICAAVTVFYFAAHLTWMGRKVFELRAKGARWGSLLFGPDSPVPGPRDMVDFLRMVRWFFGLGPKPVFERWTYWEKFDYWAVFWGVAVIGISGLVLWSPNLFTRFLPGEALNVAKVIHSEEALLATGFVFAIHFFNTHLRADKFPLDLAMLAGLVTEEELREERPELLQRLEREGKLEQYRAVTPSARTLWLTRLGGFIALGIGLALLLGILVAAMGG